MFAFWLVLLFPFVSCSPNSRVCYQDNAPFDLLLFLLLLLLSLIESPLLLLFQLITEQLQLPRVLHSFNKGKLNSGFSPTRLLLSVLFNTTKFSGILGLLGPSLLVLAYSFWLSHFFQTKTEATSQEETVQTEWASLQLAVSF